jgi:ABC-type microcin C transport system duplicated ATPase subunit YejF
MDHLEVVKLMEQSGGKVWEEGHVSAIFAQPQHRYTSAAGLVLWCSMWECIGF